jgi:ribosome maturation factor RimP
MVREADAEPGSSEVRLAATQRSGLADQLRPLVERVVESMGLELVELVLKGTRGNRVVRVDIDRPGVPGVNVDDCQRVSRELGAVLDELDLIASRYMLEVSSPGIDRPIRTTDDIRRNTGRRVFVACTGADGAKRTYRGRLIGESDACLLLADDEEGELRIPLGEIDEARQEWNA